MGGAIAIGVGDPIVVTRVAPQTIVESAPQKSRITLQLIQASDSALLHVASDGRLFIGGDRSGNEIVYRVTGWDDALAALIIERES